MIQDIAPHIYHNEYKLVPPTKESFLVYFEGEKVLIGQRRDEICFPQFQDFPELSTKLSPQLIYLFSIDNHTFYLIKHLTSWDRERFFMEDTYMLRGANPQWLAFAAITARQLHRWYDSRSFCSHCGRPMMQSDKERMLYCPDCGLMEYPKISPAIIVGVLHGDKILMSKYAGRPVTHYALIAGFAEIGETIEETVKREVFEEVGLHVKNLRYYKSQPWSISDSLLFGFFADLDGDDKITLDTQELAEAGWFTREEAPAQPLNISLTSEMIWKFKRGEV
ncbi:MAG: NAD(+) diphosphatase [Lachnospiraceae bacterium]|nr:NAD(+) diphosphatase [Lachnospiraceae bacterium]